MIVRADEGHGFSRGHSVKRGHARESRAGPAESTAAGDLHALGFGSSPGLAQGVLRVIEICAGSRKSGQRIQRASQRTRGGLSRSR